MDFVKVVFFIFSDLLYVAVPFLILGVLFFEGIASIESSPDEISKNDVDGDIEVEDDYEKEIDGSHRLMMAGFYAFISIAGASIGLAFLFYSPILIRRLAEWVAGY